MARPSLDGAGPSSSTATLVERLGVHGLDPELLTLALSHRSWCAEHPGSESNERLEFLGDAVVGLVVTEHLYRTRPTLPEGDLARLTASVVSTDALAPVGGDLGIGAVVRLGRGEDASGGRTKSSILADAFEAVIGAVYLSVGLDATAAVVTRLLGPTLERATGATVLGDPKNHLQELAAQLGVEPPRYELVEHGPDHAKRFEAEVVVGAISGRGDGGSKKRAERAAAQDAIDQLDAARARRAAEAG